MGHPDVAMFLGAYKQDLDEDGRLVLPRQFLQELGADLVVTRGFDENLMLFDVDKWQQLAGKVLAQPLSLVQSRDLRRRLFSGAALLTVDAHGRIRLPRLLCDFTGLQQEVVISAMYDYLEIWDAERWRVVQEEIDSAGDRSLWETSGV